MDYFDKMIKAPFRVINDGFRDFNNRNRTIIWKKTKLFSRHFLIISLYIFIEMFAVIYSSGQRTYVKYIPFYILDVATFYLAYSIIIPVIFKYFRSLIIRLLCSSVVVLSYSLILQLLENSLNYLKTGIFELNFTFKHFHLATARGMFLTTFAYIFYNSKYIINVERENSERRNRELELKNDLLRAQLDPHLINNVLTVLYTRVISYSTVDAEIVQLLAGLTSHSISQSDEKGYVSLKSELNNIKDNIRVFELCREKAYTVKWNISEENTAGITLPPKLLTEPIMNCLKYGKEDEEIHIDLQVMENRNLLFRTFNYKTEIKNAHSSHELGLGNLKERLSLNYPQKHQLNIIETETTFELTLILSL